MGADRTQQHATACQAQYALRLDVNDPGPVCAKQQVYTDSVLYLCMLLQESCDLVARYANGLLK